MYWYSYWANYAILYQTMQRKYTHKALVRSIHRLVNRMVLLWNPNVAFDHAVCYRIHSAYVCVSQICRLVSLIQTNPTNKTFLAIIIFLNPFKHYKHHTGFSACPLEWLSCFQFLA
jgi:hypothetical protein